MAKLIAVILAALLLAAPFNSSAADDQSEGLALLDKAIQAAGGEAKVRRLEKVAIRTTGAVLEGMGTIQLRIDWSADGLSKYRAQAEVDVMGMKLNLNLVVDGDMGWIQQQGLVREAPPGAAPAIQASLYGPRAAQALVLLKDSQFRLSPLGEVNIDNRPALGLKITHKDRKELDLFLDKETYLPVKSATRITDPDGMERAIEFRFLEPKEQDGVKLFTKIKVKLDDKEIVELELDEIKAAEKFADGTFSMPG